MTEKRTYSAAFVERLIDLGIKDCFLVTGGAIAPFTDALVRSGKIAMHYMLTEQSAGIAAEAYGHFDGRPSLLVVTSGPGVTNALTPVAAGWTNSTPMIIVSGQARTADVLATQQYPNRQMGNQHLNTGSLVRSIVKVFLEPTEDSDPGGLASQLYGAAVKGRPGPVWLSLPQDIQRKLGDYHDQMNRIAAQTPTLNYEISASNLAEGLWEHFGRARKPVLFLGNGARVSDSQPKIAKIAEATGAAVLTTWTGIDLIDSKHSNFVGRPGTIASSWAANLVQQAADLVVVLGARLDLAQVGFQPENFAPEAEIHRIDIDSAEFIRLPTRESIRNYALNAQEVVEELYSIAIKSSFPKNMEWWNDISNYKKLPKAGDYRTTDGLLSTYDVVDELSDLNAENVVLGSSGTCVEMVLQSWKVSKNQRFQNSGGLGSMGFALAGAYGVSKKTGSGKMLVIESDGSFSMNIQDLQSMAMSNVTDFKLVILNSDGYKSISISQGKQGQVLHGESKATGLFLPEVKPWALAAGFEHAVVKHSSGLKSAIQKMWNSNGHYLLELWVSPTEEALPRLNSRPNQLGQMQTANFIDLSPSINS